MKANIHAHLQGVSAKYVARSRKYTTSEEVTSSSKPDSTSDGGQTAMIKRKMRAVQENRITRIESLRAQVQAGTYRVDSMVLAQCILSNESHFMDSIKG